MQGCANAGAPHLSKKERHGRKRQRRLGVLSKSGLGCSDVHGKGSPSVPMAALLVPNGLQIHEWGLGLECRVRRGGTKVYRDTEGERASRQVMAVGQSTDDGVGPVA